MLISKFDCENIEQEVRETEARYAFTFPPDYKTFLLRYHGGYTPKTRFRVKKLGSDIRGFYGLGPVALPVSQARPEVFVEKGLFPIAVDSFGNYILIGVRKACYGQIYFCDHEAGGKTTKLADSFGVFLTVCKSEKIPDAAQRSIEARRADLTARGREHIITPALIALWQAEIDKYGGMVQEEVDLR